MYFYCSFGTRCVNGARRRKLCAGVQVFFNLRRRQFQITSEAVSQRLATQVAQ